MTMDRLPDELIIALLSLLPLKEAGRCSVFSRRWKALWRFFSGKLDFDDPNTIQKMNWEPNPDTDSRSRAYVSWVNRILESNQASSVDGFRIRFFLNQKYASDIDGWIDFAMEKKVKSFELDLSWFTRGFLEDCYDFPSNKVSSSAFGFSSLKDLRLVHIRVSNEAMEELLSNSPLLENLCLDGLESLSDLTISSGKTPALRNLEVIHCEFLEKFQVSALNLVSCTYVVMADYVGVPFKNVPLLSELVIWSYYSKSVLISPSEHSSYLPRIKKLKIKPPRFFTQYHSISPELELFNLTQLELYFIGYMGENLIYYTSLIKASPNLRIFTVKLSLGEDWIFPLGVVEEWLSTYQQAREATRCSHKNLKLIEMKGFVGCQSDLELALQLVEVAVLLEKIIIEPIRLSKHQFPKPLLEASALNSARNLQSKLRPGTELLIL